MTRFLVLISFLLVTVGSLSAQRYAHLNFANVLSEIPATKAAEKKLEEFNQQLVKKGEEMAATLQQQATELEGQQQTLAPVEFESRRKALIAKRDELVKYEQKSEFDLEKKRQELLGPLIQSVKNAVRVVAEREGYQLVFDTSIFNAVLFAQESVDLVDEVMAELGVE